MRRPIDIATYFDVTKYGKPTGNTIFIFGGWNFGRLVYRPLLRNLTKRGFDCVLYVPSKHLIAIGTPYSEIVAAAKRAAEDVKKRINQDRTASYGCIGISFGTAFATESTKASGHIKKLLLCAPFGDFSEHVELWTGHKYFSQVLASQPTDQKASGEVLNQVGLHKNLDSLKSKELLVCYSDNDTITHTSVAEKFVRLLVEHNLSLKVLRVKGNHIPGIFRSLFINKSYITFFMDK